MQHGTDYSEPSPTQSAENTQLHIHRHARKCRICRHPDREEIEQEYADWFTIAEIARNYEVDDSALQRHFKAVGLVSRRRENLRIVLDRILERGVQTPVTAGHIIRAVKAQACLTDDNRWLEPERKVIYVRAGAGEDARPKQ